MSGSLVFGNFNHYNDFPFSQSQFCISKTVHFVCNIIINVFSNFNQLLNYVQLLIQKILFNELGNDRGGKEYFYM